jgi:hypothetical protein
MIFIYLQLLRLEDYLSRLLRKKPDKLTGVNFGDIEKSGYFRLSTEFELKAIRLNISLILDLTRLL